MSNDINLKISVAPVGLDRFVINIVNTATGLVIRTITGNDPNGFTEADLRDANGLPKCGLSEVQIDQAVTLANSRR
jgi:hypothetical protein